MSYKMDIDPMPGRKRPRVSEPGPDPINTQARSSIDEDFERMLRDHPIPQKIVSARNDLGNFTRDTRVVCELAKHLLRWCAKDANAAALGHRAGSAVYDIGDIWNVPSDMTENELLLTGKHRVQFRQFLYYLLLIRLLSFRVEPIPNNPESEPDPQFESVPNWRAESPDSIRHAQEYLTRWMVASMMDGTTTCSMDDRWSNFNDDDEDAYNGHDNRASSDSGDSNDDEESVLELPTVDLSQEEKEKLMQVVREHGARGAEPTVRFEDLLKRLDKLGTLLLDSTEKARKEQKRTGKT